jgi:hypothetical protein
MVRVLPSSVIDHEFLVVSNKDYIIAASPLSTQYYGVLTKNARNQVNVS